MPLPTIAYHGRGPNLTGKKAGRLTVIGYSEQGKRWVCRCSCGNYVHRRMKSIKKCMAGEIRPMMYPKCEYVNEKIIKDRYWEKAV